MANNPYVNKVVYGNITLIDTSGVTVTPDKLAEGYTALDASGALITGTASGGGGVTDISSYLEVWGGYELYDASSINYLKGYKIGDAYYVVADIIPDFENNDYFVAVMTNGLRLEGIEPDYNYRSISSATYNDHYSDDGNIIEVYSDLIASSSTPFETAKEFYTAVSIKPEAYSGGNLVVNFCWVPI